MLIDFAQEAVETDLRAGVCIVGAGAAGVTLARGLAADGMDICLLESGGFDHDPVTQSLRVGENVGMPYYDLDHSRLRFL
ncbi:MAG: GMC family oxidoreductase, partial [Gammaproteobacteria bacterium]|nr:GMC family oxidoreductase [Gammaproteobacteria bacterium]